MIYRITRVSDYTVQPCDEAFKTSFEYWDERWFNESEFNTRLGEREGLWRSRGKNHTVTKSGGIKRQMDDVECWAVEINSLEELNDFSDEHGELVFYNDDKQPKIEIYDGYRE